MRVITEEGVIALEALAKRMQAVFGGATAKHESDNAYDYAKQIRAIITEHVSEASANGPIQT